MCDGALFDRSFKREHRHVLFPSSRNAEWPPPNVANGRTVARAHRLLCEKSHTCGVGSSACIGASSVANAALVCTTSSCTETVGHGPSPTDFSTILTLDKTAAINSGEALTSVTFSYSDIFTASGSVTNSAPSTTTFSVSVNSAITFANGTGAPANLLPGGDTLSLNLTSAYTLAAGASAPFSGSANGTGTLGPITTGLVAFEGLGTFQVNVSTLTGTTINGGGGNINTALALADTPEVTITYNYSPVTPVPEPSTWAMMILGFMGVGFMAYRRKLKPALNA
jgi:hypothetical protein